MWNDVSAGMRQTAPCLAHQPRARELHIKPLVPAE